MAPALKPPTPTMMTTEPPASSSGNDPQQQLLSSSSSTVSQSPIQEDDDNNDALIGADHSCNNNDGAVTSSTMQQQQQSSSRSNTTIINPYKKSIPPSSSPSNSHKDQESNNSSNKRRQFIERYRLQAVHHTQHYSRQQQRRGGVGVSKVISSRSALEVLRLNQTWRQIWRQSGQPQPNSGDSANSSEKQQEGAVAVRPRLFLFQRLMQQQQQQQRQQEQQLLTSQQGVWELGTGITEISGEGGSGKTQICLGLCMNCALTPLLFASSTDNSNPTTNNIGSNFSNSSNDPLYYTSIYITMGEGTPQSKIASRLDQMVRHRLTPHNHNHNTNTNLDNTEDEEMERILSRIWLLSLKNEDDFIEFVEIHLPNILNNQLHGIKPHHQQQQQRPNQQHEQQQSVPPNNQYPISDRIGFIAFDGIANFFRFSDPLFQQFQSSSSYNNQRSMFHQTRSSKLFQLSSLLRRMSDLYDVPIVITNQVTMSVPSDDGLLKRPSAAAPTTSSLSYMGQQDGNHQVQPALGLIWSNCVTTRFILQRKDGLMAKISTENDKSNESEKKGATTRMQRVRKARVLQSVCTPEESEVWYFIDTGAVVAVS